MTKKARILVKGPALSASGYGEHCRFLIRSLLKNPLCDLYVDNIKWGNLGFDLSVYDEIPQLKEIINTTKQIVATNQAFFDISVQVTIPNEFEKISPYNVGVTAGIETDRVSKEWIEKCNEMDKIITISKHSKDTLENTIHQIEEKIIKLNTPVSVVPYPVLKSASSSIELNLETDFNFIAFSLLGVRKNLENTILWFVEEFKNEEVGLVLKTAFMSGTIRDRRRVEQHIKRVVNSVPGEKKCKVYLLHGRLTAEEKNALYNHEKIKCLVSLAHGEGFGLPLFEAAYNGLPIIAPNWSGHVDFLNHEVTDKKGKKRVRGLFSKVEYELQTVQEQAVWDGVIPKDSRWCYPKKVSFKKALKEMVREYDRMKSRANKLQKLVEEKYESEAIHNLFADEVHGEKFTQTKTEDLPKISIITSVYDGDEFIEQFMENITSQTIFESNCELILVNANSPGKEEEVINKYLEKFPDNIKYHKLDEDPGIYGVWNKAIEMSTGEYITNANLDDRRREDCLELQAKTLYNNRDVGLVYCDNYQTNLPNISFYDERISSRYITDSSWNFEKLVKVGNAPHNSPMWRKDIHDKYGKFDETLRSAGDWEMWLRGASQGMKMKKIHIPLGLYYFNPQGISTKPDNQAWKNQEERKVVEKYFHILEKK